MGQYQTKLNMFEHSDFMFRIDDMFHYKMASSVTLYFTIEVTLCRRIKSMSVQEVLKN